MSGDRSSIRGCTIPAPYDRRGAFLGIGTPCSRASAWARAPMSVATRWSPRTWRPTRWWSETPPGSSLGRLGVGGRRLRAPRAVTEAKLRVGVPAPLLARNPSADTERCGTGSWTSCGVRPDSPRSTPAAGHGPPPPEAPRCRAGRRPRRAPPHRAPRGGPGARGGMARSRAASRWILTFWPTSRHAPSTPRTPPIV